MVHWGLDEARVLRNLGVEEGTVYLLKAAMTRPGRFKPFAHQVETSAFLTLNRKAFVFSEPGTGKTLSALWAADYLLKIGEVRRCLVLCPLSIMSLSVVAGCRQQHHPSLGHRSAPHTSST